MAVSPAASALPHPHVNPARPQGSPGSPPGPLHMLLLLYGMSLLYLAPPSVVVDEFFTMLHDTLLLPLFLFLFFFYLFF